MKILCQNCGDLYDLGTKCESAKCSSQSKIPFIIILFLLLFAGCKKEGSLVFKHQDVNGIHLDIESKWVITPTHATCTQSGVKLHDFDIKPLSKNSNIYMSEDNQFTLVVGNIYVSVTHNESGKRQTFYNSL